MDKDSKIVSINKVDQSDQKLSIKKSLDTEHEQLSFLKDEMEDLLSSIDKALSIKQN